MEAVRLIRIVEAGSNDNIGAPSGADARFARAQFRPLPSQISKEILRGKGFESAFNETVRFHNERAPGSNRTVDLTRHTFRQAAVSFQLLHSELLHGL